MFSHLYIVVDIKMGDEKQCEMRNKMMLFGLLIRRIFEEEKGKILEEANSEITELKKVRNEDGKANEKVVSIIATQKQNWLKERYKLRLQIEALMRELRNMEKRKRESLSELKEKEGLLQSKDKAMEELEEKLVKAKKEVEDLREAKERDVQEHSSELSSSQRQLEAELNRANKQIDAKRHELEELSLQVIKMGRDVEQKDRVLAMMLKKSKLDINEKEDEDESKKWRSNSKSRKHERRSLRSMFAFEAKSKPKTNSVCSITHTEHLELNKDVATEIMDTYSISDLNELSKSLKTKKGRESYVTLKAAQSDAEEDSEKESFLLENESSSITGKPPWRMDLHALGVSFKIKRLKQQLMMLERYIKSQQIENSRVLLLPITLLSKQVTRYHSLQEKIDYLCKRIHVNDPDKISRKFKANGEAKTSLEHFLDETFQLQRYIVATGQKLIEIQSKITCTFVEVLVSLISTEISTSSRSFDPERFAESIKSLFQEVQRGIEVRISRIIGDLEGTLAREGMIQLKQRT